MDYYFYFEDKKNAKIKMLENEGSKGLAQDLNYGSHFRDPTLC